MKNTIDLNKLKTAPGEVGNGIEAPKAGFSFFGDEVAEAFDKHVATSVPEYDHVQKLVARLSTFFLVDGGVVVDWGCSTGRTIYEVAKENPDRRVRYVGVDESPAMIAKARDRLLMRNPYPLAPGGAYPKIEFVTASLEDHAVPDDTCLVISLYALQFLPPQRRWVAIRAAAEALERGGALILVEKVVPDDAELAAPFQEVLWEEKRGAGFGPGEILEKARSLQGRLRPVAASVVEAELRVAGLRPTRFWQHLLFAGWVAVKP